MPSNDLAIRAALRGVATHSRSLAARLTVWYAGSALALVLITTGFMYWFLITDLDAADDHFLADKVHILRNLLRDRPENAAMLKYETEREWAVSRYMQVSVRILDEAGRTEVETPGMDRSLAPQVFPSAVTVDAEPGRGTEIRTPEGKSFRTLAARASVGSAGREGRVIQVALDRTSVLQHRSRCLRILWLGMGVALGVCALVSHMIARRGIGPIEEIAGTARRDSTPALAGGAAVKDYYDTLAEDYDRLRSLKKYHEMNQFEISLVKERVRGQRVLELGPGTGRLTSALVESAERVMALELSDVMIRELASRISAPNLQLVNRNLFEMKDIQGYGEYDCVVAFRVLPHVQDIGRALSLMRDSVHVGGRLLFDLWNSHSVLRLARKLFGKPEDVFTQYVSHLEMRRLIRMSNLRIVNMHYWGFPHLGPLSAEFLRHTPLRVLAYCVIFECARE